jgi:hypothetical protein
VEEEEEVGEEVEEAEEEEVEEAEEAEEEEAEEEEAMEEAAPLTCAVLSLVGASCPDRADRAWRAKH